MSSELHTRRNLLRTVAEGTAGAVGDEFLRGGPPEPQREHAPEPSDLALDRLGV